MVSKRLWPRWARASSCCWRAAAGAGTTLARPGRGPIARWGRRPPATAAAALRLGPAPVAAPAVRYWRPCRDRPRDQPCCAPACAQAEFAELEEIDGGAPGCRSGAVDRCHTAAMFAPPASCCAALLLPWAWFHGCCSLLAATHLLPALGGSAVLPRPPSSLLHAAAAAVVPLLLPRLTHQRLRWVGPPLLQCA